jgi:hypothetical protein
VCGFVTLKYAVDRLVLIVLEVLEELKLTYLTLIKEYNTRLT